MSTPASSDSAPVATVLVLAYQQREFVQECVRACLAFEGGPWEIIFSDDASTDGTFEALQAALAGYPGPHRVVVRRNARNLGIGGHYNALVPLARGELLFTAAADDLSTPDRIRRTVEAWEARGRRPDLIASNLIDLSADGQDLGLIRVDQLEHWQGVAQWAEARPYVVGAAQAFTRRMFERFGPLDPEVFYEDQIFTFRAIATGGAITLPEALVRYRRGGTSARPRFSSPQQMMSWTARQLRREVAEARQLLADAAALGCEETVRAAVSKGLDRKAYHLAILETRDWAQRWALFRAADQLPAWWRLRKALHVQWPRLSWRLRRHVRKSPRTPTLKHPAV